MEQKTVLFGKNDIQLVKFLVSRGVDIQVKDKKGKTALFYVKNIRVKEFLLDQKTKINHK